MKSLLNDEQFVNAKYYNGQGDGAQYDGNPFHAIPVF
jgi:hypothetical protein